MGAKKLVRKPRNKDYKKIIDITQSILYSPKKESWFCSYLNLSAERVMEATQYLCYIGYLEKLPDKTYAVARDFRLKIRGIYHSDGVNGHVHADAQRRIKNPIFVPKKWSMGAKHGDRVEIAVEGEFSETNTGVVHEIINPWSDNFVGRLSYMSGKWYVIPCDKGIGEAIEVSNPLDDFKAGEFVYASFCNTEFLRQKAFLSSSIAQRKKTILWSEICGGDKPEPYTQQILSCNIVKVFESDEERINFEYQKAYECNANITIPKKKGKPYTRQDLTYLKTFYISDALGVSKTKEGKYYVHVPDLTEYIALNSEIEKRVLETGRVPSCIQEKSAFKMNLSTPAITVEFDTKDVKMYRSLVCVNSSDFKEDLQDPINTVNDKVASWFDARDAVAPYVEISYVEKGKTFYLSDFCGDSCEQFEVADFVPSGDFTVYFCNPFNNYLAFLTQHCFAHCISQHKSSEECEFANLIREKCALSTYSGIRAKLFNTAQQNIKIDLLQKQGADYPATYLYETKDGNGLLYCNGGFGLCESDDTLSFGAPVRATYKDISVNRLDLYYSINKKEI